MAESQQCVGDSVSTRTLKVDTTWAKQENNTAHPSRLGLCTFWISGGAAVKTQSRAPGNSHHQSFTHFKGKLQRSHTAVYESQINRGKVAANH